MMTYNDQMLFQETPIYFESVNHSWLAGATDALSILPPSKRRMTDHEWQVFIQDIMMKSQECGIESVDSYSHNDMLSSLFDRLGGYVSIAGKNSDGGIRFRITPVYQDLLSLISSYGYEDEDDFVVPTEMIERFLMMVPIRGPLTKEMEVDAL